MKTAHKRREPIDLTQGPCWKVILLFSLPVILSYLLQQVYTIIDGRYKSGKPMVITTNLDPRRINDASGDEAWKRVFDRILERCYPIEFNGSNRRAAKKMEMREAMRKRLGL